MVIVIVAGQPQMGWTVPDTDADHGDIDDLLIWWVGLCLRDI